jgi:DNA polymerase III alpha subunit
LEDEDGLINVILKPHIYKKYRYIARMEPLIVVEGMLQKGDGVCNIVAERLIPLREERKRQQTMYDRCTRAMELVSVYHRKC